jgi:hypothetical protein
MCKEGLHTVIISGGMNSLHFSSGSIDLAGYTEKGAIVKKPFEYIKDLIKSNKEHPYTKIGLSSIKRVLIFSLMSLPVITYPSIITVNIITSVLPPWGSETNISFPGKRLQL